MPLEEVNATLPGANSPSWYQNKWVWVGLAAGVVAIVAIYWLIRQLYPATPEDLADLQKTIGEGISQLQKQQSNLNESGLK